VPIKTTLKRIFGIDASNSSLVMAQVAAFSRQVPLLYFILAVNTVTLALNHVGIAPQLLVVDVPGALLLVCAYRVVIWLKTRHQVLSLAQAVTRLRATTVLGGLLGVLFLCWSLALYPYGDARSHGHITFFVGITVVSCIFCLMRVRSAALTLTLAVAVPFAMVLMSKGGATEFSIGLNLLLVTGAMVYVLINSSGDFERMISAQDAMRKLSDENLRLANLDSLTDLPNRRRFFAELEGQIRASARLGTEFVVGVIDLDGFKPVNDLHGHAVGDLVLREAGRRLTALSNDGIFVARLGGDEFGIILRHSGSPDEILGFGDRVCLALRAPYTVRGIQCNLSGSLGFAFAGQTGASPEELYERADHALYHAKGNRRGHPVIFSAEHEIEIRRQGLIEQRLQGADIEAEMRLDFQPVFDTRSGRPVAMEALARWTSPELGPLSPAVFIPIAERSEMINILTRSLLRKALAAAREWPEPIRIAFNLSARDVVSEEAMAQIIAIIETSGFPPHRIDMEVTETSVMTDLDRAEASLLRLRAVGVGIALDDFGTGYSSLSCVHRLPLDKIKIDRGFVVDIGTRKSSRDVVETIVAMCRNFDIECVVEGIETAEQAAILSQMGCRLMQGYHFGRPMPKEAVPAFIRQAAAAPIKTNSAA